MAGFRLAAFIISVTLVAAVVAGAAATQPSATPAANSPAVAGDFVWRDLVSANPAAARAFYGALLGWTFEAGDGVDPGYTIIRQGDLPIGGIVHRRVQPGAPAADAQWLSYVAVADVDRAVAAPEAAGGKRYRGPLNARRDLRVAAVADPQGAAIGFASRGPLAGGDRVTPPALYRWLWMEYVARDVPGALDFYSKVIGFSHRVGEVRPQTTYYLLDTDRPRAGLFATPWPRDTSTWLPYVRVEDPAAKAARAVELGGSVLLAPRADIRFGSLAIVIDPEGAAVALQKFPFEKGATP